MAFFCGFVAFDGMAFRGFWWLLTLWLFVALPQGIVAFMKEKREIIADIKNSLQYPQTVLEIMRDRGLRRKEISPSVVDDALRALGEAVRILNELANWN